MSEGYNNAAASEIRKRDLFAGLAMQVLLSNVLERLKDGKRKILQDTEIDEVSETAFDLAHAMLRVRSERRAKYLDRKGDEANARTSN